MLDLIILDGTVIDGSGSPKVKQDVGILKGEIAKIGELKGVPATQVIDAEGLIICPGFIDIHSHADWNLLIDPKAESAIHQGLTTVVVGNCGFSNAPIRDKQMLSTILPSYLRREVEIDWHSFGEYLQRVESRGLALNVVHLVGHSALRIAAMGFDNRAPDAKELADMKQLLIDALDQGGCGVSFGLEYAPGSNATIEEMVVLCQDVSDRGLFYAVHMRNQDYGYLDAIDEVIEVARRSGASLEISHITPHACLEQNIVIRALEKVQLARQEGVNVNFDAHPYLWNETFLSTFLPPWAFEGGVNNLLKRLSDPVVRKMIKQHKGRLFQPLYDRQRWDSFILSQSQNNPQFAGKSIKEISNQLQMDPEDVILELLYQEGEGLYDMRWLVKGIEESAVPKVLSDGNAIIGTDGMALCRQGPLASIRAHPRSWGATAKLLGEYVREKELMSLEMAVHKFTAMPARKVGLTDRGFIGEGYIADLVLFHPDTIRDRATYQEPNQPPERIDYVIILGEIVLDHGEQTDAMPGRILRSN